MRHTGNFFRVESKMNMPWREVVFYILLGGGGQVIKALSGSVKINNESRDFSWKRDYD